MIITHIGHSEFLLELESGYRIVTDPYNRECGYPIRNVVADTALVSHHHGDHDAVDLLGGNPTVIDYAGEHTITPDIRLTAIRSWHDEQKGAQRGGNLLFMLETEGLRVVHLGDLGCMPEPDEINMLSGADVLMIPVGGFFTINAEKAKEIADLLEPRIILPMHYKTSFNADWPIAPVDDFVKLYEGEVEYLSQLRVTKDDLNCQPRIAVLEYQE